jgi:hypothetical protein
MPSKYDEQIREKAVRLVRDHAEDYPTEWAAIKAVSGRLGMNARPNNTNKIYPENGRQPRLPRCIAVPRP